MKYLIGLLIIFILFSSGFSQTSIPSDKRTPVIVEIFTSEGCSTCPPADKYIQKLLAEQPIPGVEVIALSEHVDYWNRPEWTDKFSSAQFSNRQKYYAVFFKRTDIYTPQMIIDGTLEIRVKDGIKLLAESAGKERGEIGLTLEKNDGNSLMLNVKVTSLPKISDGDRALVLIAVTENNLIANVSGGENKGQKMRHTAVTRFLKNIGDARDGETNLSAEIKLGKEWKREELNIVAFVQEANSRRILGAAKINLKD